MTALKRYSPEEDKLILENWWNPDKRDEILEKLDRSTGSINFRYYSLLKKYNIDPSQHRRNKGVLPAAFSLENNEDDVVSMIVDQIEQLEVELKKEIKEIYSALKEQEEIIIEIQEFILEKLPGGAVNKRLLLENKQLKQDLQETKDKYFYQIEQNNNARKEIEQWIEDFYKLSNLDKLKQLYDFFPKVKESFSKKDKPRATLEDVKDFIKY